MATNDSQFETAESEELVAYLDGELPPEDCRRVEERLAADADYRQQLRDLDQAWEALDTLPAAHAGDNFARTTIEMVAVAAQHDADQHATQAAVSQRKRSTLWIVAGVLTAFAAFGATRQLAPDANDRLLADLPVIKQLDLLNQGNNADFLQKLSQAVPIEQLTHDLESVDRELAEIQLASAPDFNARKTWLEGLTPDQKAALQGQVKRFEELKRSTDVEALRNLEHSIASATDANELQRTMIAYGRWLAHRSAGDQEELRSMPADERLDWIQRTVRRESDRAARHLSDEDRNKLRQEIFDIYQERESDFRRANRRRDPDNKPRLDGPPERRALMVLHWELTNDDRDDKTRDRLIRQLSPEARQHWESLGGNERDRDRGGDRDRDGDRERQRRTWQLWQWIMESMMPPRLGPEELEQFFAVDLNNNERQRLLGLPADEMQLQLKRLYLANQLGFRGAGEPDGEFGPRGSFPPFPPPGRRGEGPPLPRNFDRPDDPPAPRE